MGIMTSLTDITRRFTTVTALVGGVMFLQYATPALAQASGTDPRWQPWLGCWEAVETASPAAGATTQAPRVCVIPAAGASSVEIVTVVGDSIATRQLVEATGEEHQVSRDGCTGWDRARWSAGGERVYLRSQYTCTGGLTRQSDGVMAMSESGEWLDIEGVQVGSGTGVRVSRYRTATGEASLPSEIATALQGRSLAVNSARVAATAPLTTEDVAEASHFLDAGVIETWLAERGDGFALDAKQLLGLQEAGVPSTVIDVMVALSYPKVFALDRSRAGALSVVSNPTASAGTGQTTRGYPGGMFARSQFDCYDPLGYDPFGFSVFGYSPYGYSPYGYAPYGAGCGYGYRYGYGGWYYGNQPVVVVVKQPPADNTSEQDRHGRVVKGRGYTAPRGSTASGSSASGSSGGSASQSGGSASSGSTGSGSSSGRTAKPRRPE
jgi:hypothetical protein